MPVRRRRRQFDPGLGTPRVTDFDPNPAPLTGAFTCSGAAFGPTRTVPAGIWIGDAATYKGCATLVAQTVSRAASSRRAWSPATTTST